MKSLLKKKGIQIFAASFGGIGLGVLVNERFEAKPWKTRFSELESRCAKQTTNFKAQIENLSSELETTKEQMAKMPPFHDSNWDCRNDKRPPKDVTRTLLLIRHGQYFDQEKEAEKRKLTELGKLQCEKVAQRLKEFGFDYDKIHISTKVRAKESGDLIRKHFPNVPYEYNSLLEEGWPGPRIPGKKREITEKKRKQQQQIKEGYYSVFHRANETCTKPQIEIVVCHQNVIRSFVCRALQIPPECWLRMGGFNSGITSIKINPNGSCSMQFFADIGHLDAEEITFSTKPRGDFVNLQKIMKK